MDKDDDSTLARRAARGDGKVTRVTIYPTLPRISAGDLRRYSPLSPQQRQRVEAAITRLDESTPPTPERLQRAVIPLRDALERVERVALTGYLEIGRWLVRLKERTPHGAFLSLFSGAKNALDLPLPMDIKKAQALMRVAQHPVLGDPRNWKALPTANWRTMDDLARLGQVCDLDGLIRSGRVHRNVSRREVQALSPLSATLDPLAPVRAAIHGYHGPRAALIACLRAELQVLEAEADGDHDDEEEGQ